MGKIEKMQNMQDELNISRLKKQNLKPKLRITGVKDLATLIGPNAKHYRLSKGQKNFQIKGRLTIAAIAAALAISGGVSIAHSVNSNKNTNTNAIEAQEILQKDEVLKDFEAMLKQWVFGDDLEDINTPRVNYIDEEDGHYLKVTSEIRSHINLFLS